MTDSEYIYTQGMVEQMIEEARLEERRSRVKWAALCDAEEIWGTDIIVFSEWGTYLHVKDGLYDYIDGSPGSIYDVMESFSEVTFFTALEPGREFNKAVPMHEAEATWGTDIIVKSERGAHLHVKDGRYIYVNVGAFTYDVEQSRDDVTFVTELAPGEVIEEALPEVEFKVGDAVLDLCCKKVWVRGDNGSWTAIGHPGVLGDLAVHSFVEDGEFEYIILNGKVV